jgi:hypothetical protein
MRGDFLKDNAIKRIKYMISCKDKSEIWYEWLCVLKWKPRNAGS